MGRFALPALFAVVLAVQSPTHGSPTWARQLPPERHKQLAGIWQIEFANGVVEQCEFNADGTAFEKEPLRESKGRVKVQENSTLVVFDDDRTERWTRVDGKMVVEHWCPSSAFPHSAPIVGKAKLVR